jgi:hypothetical protein
MQLEIGSGRGNRTHQTSLIGRAVYHLLIPPYLYRTKEAKTLFITLPYHLATNPFWWARKDSNLRSTAYVAEVCVI